MEIDKFWTRGNLKERIKNALNEAGLNKDDLKIEDLHPIDQYHARGILATKELAEKVNVKENQTIIDVGCGLAGPARYFANKFKCNVFGIDITPAFIEVGIDFNKKTKMDDKVSLEVSDGHTLPFDNNKFDGAISQHVTMNINNRERFFSEIYRVLKNDTFFAFSEHGLGPKGNPIFPLPWADNKEMSFLIEPSLTLQLLTKIGFKKISFLETGKKYMEGYEKSLKTRNSSQIPTLGMHVIGGPTMFERQKNSMLSIKEKRTLPFEIICYKN